MSIKEKYPINTFSPETQKEILALFESERKKLIEEIREFIEEYECEYCNPSCDCGELERKLLDFLNKLN